jgi:hypothetical protein
MDWCEFLLGVVLGATTLALALRYACHEAARSLRFERKAGR